MATGTFFNSFFEDIAEKKIDLSADTLKFMLTNVAPVATNSVKADLTEIANGNGYTTGGITATGVTSAQTSGVYELDADDPVWTASGGSIATFQWVVLYDDTATGDPLIAFWNIGSAQNVADPNTYTLVLDSPLLSFAAA
jgi:hypothetical protein